MYSTFLLLKGSLIKSCIVLLISSLFIFPSGLGQIQQDIGFQCISVSYSFNDLTIERIIIDNTAYTQLSVSDLIIDGRPGEPCLPVNGAYILLPPNSKLDGISVTSSNVYEFYLDHMIVPGEKPLPLSKPHHRSLLQVDESIYSSHDLFPANLFGFVGIYRSHGYTILVLEINPVQYRPATNTIFFYPDITIEVQTRPSDLMESMIRNKAYDHAIVSSMIDNPYDMGFYDEVVSNVRDIDEAFEFLILTTDELKEGFLPLKQAHDREGITTMIATLSDVGSNDPEQIRAYIKEMYLSQGIDYVLLGGDDEVIPARMLFVSGMDEDVEYYETTMPSDLYYACLDGTYNYDEDDRWGEPTDGQQGGDVDLLSEVSVGRACVSSSDEVDIFVKKTLAFMNDSVEPYRKKVLLVGENLGNFGIASYGGNYLDQLIDGSSDDGYTTTGFPSDLYSIDTLYDRDGRWSQQDLADIINDGIGIINHLGHSNYVYNMKMYYSDLEIFTNERPCFIYSQGCMAGGFDDKDCFAEYMTVKQSYGAAAGIWNARYGWFWAYRTDGDSQRYHREFWDAVFGENIPTIGWANHRSKEDNLYLIDRSCMRWTMYQLNLFGDPILSLYPYRPLRPKTPQGPTMGTPGESYIFSTVSNDPNDDVLYYQWNTVEMGDSEWFGPLDSGDIYSFNVTWDEQGTFFLRTRVKDSDGYTSGWSEPLEVSMPQYRMIYRLFQDRYPYLFDFLSYLLS